jgi:2-methylisocitrate lyase-like PEP mutase family enzyme
MRTTTILRQALEAGEQIVGPGIYDPLSARAVVALGFNGVYLGGFASAAAPLGTLEPLMTMSEQVELARRIAHVVGDVPLIVDGHTGYGDAVHITRAVREFEAAGVAAIHIEDQLFPKRASYHKGLKHMVSLEEMQARIRAACDARRDDDFVIVARTDARGAVGGSLAETIERLQAYAEAGADVLMPMPNGLDEGREVARAIPTTPLMWFAGLGKFAPGDEVHVDTLKELGYLIVTYPIIGLCRALDAVHQLYAPLRERGVVDVDRLDEAYERIMRLIDAPFYYELEAQTTERAVAAVDSPG